MKKYQTLVVIILVTEVVQMMFLQPGSSILVHFFSDHLSNTFQTLVIVTSVLNLIIWLPAAIWIHDDAKNQPIHPIIWALAVLFLGFKGVIFYIAFLILFNLQGKVKISENITE